MYNRTVSFRLPHSLIKELETRAKTTGRSKTSLIIEVLNNAFLPANLTSTTTTSEAVSILQQQLDSLQKQVADHATQLFELRQTTPPDAHYLQQIDALEKAHLDTFAIEKSRSLVHESALSIFVIDARNRAILHTSRTAARQLGYTRRELRQFPLDKILPAASFDFINMLLQELIEKGDSVFTQRHRCKDGTEIEAEVHARVINYANRIAFQWLMQNPLPTSNTPLTWPTLTDCSETAALTAITNHTVI